MNRHIVVASILSDAIDYFKGQYDAKLWTLDDTRCPTHGWAELEVWNNLVGNCTDKYHVVEPGSCYMMQGLDRVVDISYMLVPFDLARKEWHDDYHNFIVPYLNSGVPEQWPLANQGLDKHYPSWSQLQAAQNPPQPSPWAQSLDAKYIGDPVTYPRLENFNNDSTCNHDWHEVQLFTSSVIECRKCGKEKNKC